MEDAYALEIIKQLAEINISLNRLLVLQSDLAQRLWGGEPPIRLYGFPTDKTYVKGLYRIELELGGIKNDLKKKKEV
ncbi:hypothetical protein LCGC14_1334700 [marine sediment metagenome]|uniref:Uncharacterized protein n=1 Tax=marine sediment metagenome TaxID=412755 RepID=A0A0F9NI04_9ZZZZ|nr:hypothetical protein [Desulfobacterales bacterium]